MNDVFMKVLMEVSDTVNFLSNRKNMSGLKRSIMVWYNQPVFYLEKSISSNKTKYIL